MARFCASCGTQVAEDIMFCSQCGAAIAAAEPTVADVSLQPARVEPPAAVPAPAAVPPPAKSPFLKIVVIVVLVFGLLAVAGIGTCVYIGYRAKKAVTDQIKLDEGGKGIEIPTPGGTIRMGENSDKTPTEVGGVPVYPGAKATEGGGQLSFGDKFQFGGQEFLTDDSVDQVVGFYKEKYGSELTEMQAEGHHRLSINKGTQQEPHLVTLDVQRDPDTDKTKIFMTFMGGKESQ